MVAMIEFPRSKMCAVVLVVVALVVAIDRCCLMSMTDTVAVQ